MSRVLDCFPDTPAKTRTLPKYDWKLWLDGRVHALGPAEYGDVYTFRNSAHTVAARKGLRLRTAMVDGEFVLQASETAEKPERSRPRKGVQAAL